MPRARSGSSSAAPRAAPRALALAAAVFWISASAAARPNAALLLRDAGGAAQAQDSPEDPPRDAVMPGASPAAGAAPAAARGQPARAPTAKASDWPATLSGWRETFSGWRADPMGALRNLRATALPFLRLHFAATWGAGLLLGLAVGWRGGHREGYQKGKHEYRSLFQGAVLPHSGDTPMVRASEPRTASLTAAPAAGTAAAGGSAAPQGPLLRGRYEIRRKIGSGGMGLVYEGFDHTLGRRVAIKQLRTELKAGASDRESFLREAQIISHLSHPYIVAIHEVVEENDEIYLVFDFVDGKPLSQILAERHRLPLQDCQRTFTFVCEAVASAHRAHILHRDLKPSNIMVETNGYVKVMDFGIAREAKETITRLTRADDMAGTPAYMAPEQHLGRCAKTSDIFALGVCLYEAMTGQLPFPGPDFLTQKERMNYPPPQYFASDLPKEAELLFKTTLAPDPKLRVADAAELLESLKSLKG